MTRDDIIRMAREAGMEQEGLMFYSPYDDEFDVHIDHLEAFTKLVAAAEREAIAQMIEDAPPLVDFAKNEQDGCIVCGFTPKLAALTIRARGQKCN